MMNKIDSEWTISALKAISNNKRLQMLNWILDPTRHFEPQVDGDLVDDGVCVGRLVDKIGLSQPTVTNHMQVLADAGLVSSKKIKNWVFYKPEKDKLEELHGILGNVLSISR